MRALTLLLLTGCLPSVHDVIPSGGDADRMVIDTERVCARHTTSYAELPLSTATWHDLALRADDRDPEALRTVARLMRANRARFRDSVCTAAMIEDLERGP